MSTVTQPAPAPAAFRGSAPFLQEVPPLWVPMRHFAFAALAFWLFAAGFACGQGRLLGFDFQAKWVLGLVHLLTLGWVAMTMLGAMVQMAPVLWETPLAAPLGALRAAWWAMALGIAGFVGSLWLGMDAYWVPAALILLAVLAYVSILARTMLRAPKLDWTGTHLAFSIFYLAVLAALGLLLAYDRQRGVILPDPEGTLVAHVHLALVGWVSLTIVGVSYRLVSMFAFSHLSSRTPGRLALALVNIGLLGLAADALFAGRRLMPLWAAVLAGGYAAYALQMREIFKAKNRRLDPPLCFTLLALAGGALWAGLGLALAWGWLDDSTESRAAYVWAALLGWATPYILGQIHKIVPFLVWLHVYSPRNWRPPVRVPTIQDLTSERLAWAELAAMALSTPATVAGFLAESPVLLRAGSLLLLAAASLYAVNMGLTLRHAFRRDPRWTQPAA